VILAAHRSGVLDVAIQWVYYHFCGHGDILGLRRVGLLGVYTGTSVSNLTSVASSMSVNGEPAQVSSMAAAGVSYQIAVDSAIQRIRLLV